MIGSHTRLALILVLAQLFACTPDDTSLLTSSDPFDNPASLLSAQLQYEMETVTERQISTSNVSPELRFIEDISKEATASRQLVKIGMYPDGTTDWQITEQRPRTNLDDGKKDNSLASDISPIYSTTVIGGTASYYDESGGLLYQHYVGEDSEMRTQVDKLLGNFDWLEEANRNGYPITDLGNQTVVIRRPFAAVSKGDVAAKSQDWYVEEAIVTDLNILLGHSIHEANGDIVAKTILRYKDPDENGVWLPAMMYTEEYGEDDLTKSAYVEKTTVSFENWTFKNKE